MAYKSGCLGAYKSGCLGSYKSGCLQAYKSGYNLYMDHRPVLFPGQTRRDFETGEKSYDRTHCFSCTEIHIVSVPFY